MKHKYNILVTGCGGDIGQSIGKILNECSYVDTLFGCDISDKNAGKFIFKNFFVGLKCTDPNYIETLSEFVKKHDIDIVLPIAEPELRFLAKNNILDKIGGAPLLTASARALNIGFDKLETARFLESKKLPFPISKNISETTETEVFPLILKSKTGSGSSKVYIASDWEDLEFLRKKNPDFIAQEHLDDKEGEYTCGVFRSKNGIIRTIIFKRELTGGYSGYGEVIEDEKIESVLKKIADELDLIGSINIQLRLTTKGPVVFEINPRFSSTVFFRHLFGFEDVIWSIEDLVGLPISNYIPAKAGRKFFKGFNEYIL